MGFQREGRLCEKPFPLTCLSSDSFRTNGKNRPPEGKQDNKYCQATLGGPPPRQRTLDTLFQTIGKNRLPEGGQENEYYQTTSGGGPPRQRNRNRPRPAAPAPENDTHTKGRGGGQSPVSSLFSTKRREKTERFSEKGAVVHILRL